VTAAVFGTTLSNVAHLSRSSLFLVVVYDGRS